MPPKSSAKSKGKGKARDVEAEFDAKYADNDGYQLAIRERVIEDVKRLAPTTLALHNRILARFVEYLASTKDRRLSQKARIDATNAQLAPGKELPEVVVLLEYLTFWAEGSSTNVAKNDSGKMTLTSLRSLAKVLQTALQRRVRSYYTKKQSEQINTFLHNAASGSNPLVRSIRKDKMIITLVDFEKIMQDLHDRKNGTFRGRSRLAMQMGLFLLLLYNFGTRPGCILLRPEYLKEKGEPQCLLWKDVEILYEGRIGGVHSFGVTFTLKWLKGMRDHLSDNLIVRARSLPPQNAHLCIVVSLLAQASYRKVLDQDLLAFLQKPPYASPEKPVRLGYATGKELWPVFVTNLGGRETKTNQSVKKAKADQEKGVDPEEDIDEDLAAELLALDKDDEDQPQPATSKGKGKGKAVDPAKKKKNVKLDIDYSVPALYNWAADFMSEIKANLGFHSLTPYDFRRAFAMNMRSCVSKETLEYLMGHKPGSVMVDRHYQSDQKMKDTTALRFNVQMEDSRVQRDSVGWQVAGRTERDLLAALATQVSEIQATLTARFGSFDKAMENENDQDVIALMDAQCLLLAELERRKLKKAIYDSGTGTVSSSTSSNRSLSPVTSLAASTSSATSADTSVLPNSAYSSGIFSLFDWSLDVAQSQQQGDAPLASTSAAPFKLPPLPEPDFTNTVSPADIFGGGSASASTSAIPLESADSIQPAAGSASTSSNVSDDLIDPALNALTLNAQLFDAQTESLLELQHPLVQVALSVPATEAFSACITNIIGRLELQDLHDQSKCLLCVTIDKNEKIWGESYDKHAYSHENKHHQGTLIRCPCCAEMLENSDAESAATCSHLIACANALLSKYEDDIEAARETSLADLISPHQHPGASFYFPNTGSSRRLLRPICPICLKDELQFWKKNKLSQPSLPFHSMRDFENHWIAHFKKERQVKEFAVMDWESKYSCGMPACDVKGTLRRLFPHWSKDHDLDLLRKGSSKGKKAGKVSAALLPDVLEGTLQFQSEKTQPDELAILAPRYLSNKKRKSAEMEDDD